MQDISIISTPDAPGAIGPYSQAVSYGGLLYSSGQVALDPATGEMVEGGVARQTERVFQNLQAVLAAGGTSLAHALRLTVYIKNMDDFAEINAVYATYFEGVNPPARATVEVARLPKDALVEIDCIAALPA